MSRAWKVALSVLGIVAVAAVVIVLWPAPDPLRDSDTVYVRFAGSSDGSNPSDEQAREGLVFALGMRNLTIVSDPAAADVVLEVQDVLVNLGDIELSLSNGGFAGRIAAECRITDLATGREYTMDLSVRFDAQGVTANLTARKFWMFWK